ncbi:MAG: hypothetical protein ACXWX9_07810 [Actinomycetota bacterium]
MQTWQRKTAGTVVAAVGIAFIASVVVNGLFSVGPAFERMADGFRPVMQAEPIAALDRDLDGLEAVTVEFSGVAVPMLSEALGLTPEEFAGFLGAEFPEVAAGVEGLPTIVESFRGVVGTLDAERERFASADAIPTTSLPATTVPWGLTVAGVALLVIGILIVFRAGRPAAAAAVVVGVLLIAAPLVLSLPGKASDADTMNENLLPVYTAELVAGADQGLAVVGAMGTQMQTEMLPALGQQLGMDEAALGAFLGENLPATSGAMAAMPEALGRFTTVVEVFRAHLDDYDTINSVAFVPIVWTMIVGGILAGLGGVWALLGGGRTARRAEVQLPPEQVRTPA